MTSGARIYPVPTPAVIRAPVDHFSVDPTFHLVRHTMEWIECSGHPCTRCKPRSSKISNQWKLKTTSSVNYHIQDSTEFQRALRTRSCDISTFWACNQHILNVWCQVQASLKQSFNGSVLAEWCASPWDLDGLNLSDATSPYPQQPTHPPPTFGNPNDTAQAWGWEWQVP